MTASSPNLSFTVHLSPSVIFRANMAWFWRKYPYFALLPGAAVFFLILGFFTGDPGGRHNLVVNLAPFLVICVAWFPAAYWSALSSFRSNKALQEPLTFHLSETEFRLGTVTSSGQTEWKNVYQALETKGFFFIAPSKFVRWIIPKRDLPDSAMIPAIRHLLRSSVTGKVSLLTS